MENLEIRKGIFQADVRRNIRNHIQIQYEIGFESFLQENYLADELFYINYIDKNQKEIITEYEKIVNFQDISEGEAVTDDIADQWYAEKIIRDNYWYFKEFQSFLSEKLQEITKNSQSQQIEAKPLDLLNIPTVDRITRVIKEQYSEMFSNNGFELFEHILIEYVMPKDKRGRKSDLIYYYWEMHDANPQYIHQRPEAFFKWFAKKYDETTGQLKTYDNVKTQQRIKNYSTALQWFKSIKE